MDPYAGIIKGDKAPKKEVKRMIHERSANNKHIVTHQHHSPAHHPDETHVFDKMADVHGHMDAHNPEGDMAAAAPAEGAAPAAPMTAAPSPMLGM